MEMRSLGIDTGVVERTAKTMIQMGTPEPQAWAKAFGKAIDGQPALRAPLMRIEKLVERVDTQTLARYSVALEQAYTTGDNSAVQALAPEVSKDLSQLAGETGDVGFAEMADLAISTSDTPPPPAAAAT